MFGRRLLQRLADLQKALETAQRHNRAAEAVLHERAFLTSIEQHGRMIRLVFIRRGKPYVVEFLSTWDDTPDQWRKDLLQ